MSTEEFIQSKDGTKLMLRSWLPQQQAQAVVVFCHGFLAHAGLYEWPGGELAARTYAVYAADLRGHGKSEGERLFIKEMREYVEDVHAAITTAKERHPGLPVFLVGHSAGGVISCMYTLEHQSELAGFVCESFAHEVYGPEFALTVVRGLSHLAPHAHVLKLKHADYSRVPGWTEQLLADPLIPKEGYPTSTVAELARADMRLKTDFAQITLPVLILHGTEDKVTKPHGSQVFAERGGSADKTLKMYEGHWHDLLNDIGKERVLGDIEEWMRVRAR